MGTRTAPLIMDDEQLKLTQVAETVLKKRKSLERAHAAKRAEDILANQKAYKRPKGGIQYKSAESFIKDHRSQRKAVTRARRNASIPVDAYMKDTYEDQLMFVIRVRGMNSLEPKAKKVLARLRLLQMNNAIFMKADAASAELLKTVDPYVSFGYPSRKQVEELIFKRGHGTVDKRRVALNDNRLIEDALGKSTGVICVEDIVHEVFNVGPHFQEASDFLWPFRLNSIKTKVTQEEPMSIKGKTRVFGNQKAKINDIIQKML